MEESTYCNIEFLWGGFAQKTWKINSPRRFSTCVNNLVHETTQVVLLRGEAFCSDKT